MPPSSSPPSPPAARAFGWHGARIEVVVGDITRLALDAIVNAANASLLGGGGVDGAIHRAAGPELRAHCLALGGCPTGEARITPGFALPARRVIHTVGPVWRGGGAGEDALLSACYRESLALATAEGLSAVAFPAISTGVYGFPPERAAPLAVQAVLDHLEGSSSVTRVVFCCFSPAAAELHHDALDRSRAQPL
ncbi:O-acetyl-ADP-ribose deacetylase [Xanthobacter sediminis]